MINFEYKITEQEYRDFCLYTGWLSPDKKSRRIKYYTTNMFFYIGFSFFLSSILGGFLFTIPGIIIHIIIGILLFIYLRSSINSHYDKHVKNAIKESGEDKILSLANLNFSESGILEKTNSSEVKYNWSAIIKKTEVHNCYYLYTTSLHALIVPKRVFSSHEEKSRFEKFLLQHIPLQAEFNNLKR